MEDLSTALVRFQTNTEMFGVEGFDNAGIGNATRGEAPKVEANQPAVSLFGQLPSNLI